MCKVLWRAAIYIVLAVGVSGFRELNSDRITKFCHMVLISGGSLVGVLYVDWLGSIGHHRCAPRQTAFTRFLKIPLVITLIGSFVVFISRDSFLLHVMKMMILIMRSIFTHITPLLSIYVCNRNII
jgi:hypothetical protein